MDIFVIRILTIISFTFSCEHILRIFNFVSTLTVPIKPFIPQTLKVKWHVIKPESNIEQNFIKKHIKPLLWVQSKIRFASMDNQIMKTEKILFYEKPQRVINFDFPNKNVYGIGMYVCTYMLP